MSITKQVGDIIRTKITDNIKPVFDGLSITFNPDHIVNDFARFSGDGLEATFYIQGLDNVKRKEFNSQVDNIKSLTPSLKEFKVKFKRPEKEVRFYINIVNENS